MRSFHDARGRLWDVVVGKESFGTMVLLFAIRRGSDLRRDPVEGDSRFAAERVLSNLDEDELRARLERACAFDPSIHAPC